MELTEVDGIIDGYGAEQASLVMILQDVQDALNYLPAEALHHVAKRLDLGLSRVYNVATFYSSFSLIERGKHIIKVCDGTACHLRGSTILCDEVKRRLDIDVGETTKDGLFTLETVACLGACALAPVMSVSGKYYGQMTLEKVKETLDAYRGGVGEKIAG